MKNFAYNVKIKWNGSIENTALASTIGGNRNRGSMAETNDDTFGASEEEIRQAASEQARSMGFQVLNDEDRRRAVGNDNIRQMRPALQQENGEEEKRWCNNADGVLLAWKDVVYASTEEEFNGNWKQLKDQFHTQTG